MPVMSIIPVTLLCSICPIRSVCNFTKRESNTLVCWKPIKHTQSAEVFFRFCSILTHFSIDSAGFEQNSRGSVSCFPEVFFRFLSILAQFSLDSRPIFTHFSADAAGFQQNCPGGVPCFPEAFSTFASLVCR
jgi:hypothetical protein